MSLEDVGSATRGCQATPIPPLPSPIYPHRVAHPSISPEAAAAGAGDGALTAGLAAAPWDSMEPHLLQRRVDRSHAAAPGASGSGAGTGVSHTAVMRGDGGAYGSAAAPPQPCPAAPLRLRCWIQGSWLHLLAVLGGSTERSRGWCGRIRWRSRQQEAANSPSSSMSCPAHAAHVQRLWDGGAVTALTFCRRHDISFP